MQLKFFSSVSPKCFEIIVIYFFSWATAELFRWRIWNESSDSKNKGGDLRFTG